MILAVGTGCPIPLLYSETGTPLMANRVLQRKLTFLHHVANLPLDSLAREIYDLQAANQLPGLVSECAESLSGFGLSNLHGFSPVQGNSR